MEIIITPNEATDKYIWAELCKPKGWGPYIVNEGLMSADEKIRLNEIEAIQLGLLPSANPTEDIP